MDEFLTDQQQAERVKQWLRENGAFILGGLALGLAGLFGWNQWQSYRTAQGEQASALYEEFTAALGQDRVAKAMEFLADLESDYAATPYLNLGRLALARTHMDRNEFEEAAASLAAIVADGPSDEIEHVARLRLARVHLQQQDYEAALEVLGGAKPGPAFAPRYHEVRGDVHYAMGQMEEARSEYQVALEGGEAGAIDRVFVQAKLDDLGISAITVVTPDEPAAEPEVEAEEAEAEAEAE